jgi:hypothetical protein
VVVQVTDRGRGPPQTDCGEADAAGARQIQPAGTASAKWLAMILTCRSGLLCAAFLALAPAVSSTAQNSSATEATEKTPARWHLSGALGYGAAGGEYGAFLEKPVLWEFRIAKSSAGGAWRFGGGVQFGSMTMKAPYQDQLEWGRMQTFLTVARVFNRTGRVRPYLLGKVAIERIHPRSELFYFDEPENLDPGASPTKFANGVGVTLQPGVEIGLNKTLALDISGFWNTYKTSDYSLIPPLHGPLKPPLPGGETASSGREWGLKVGLTWQPFAAAPLEAPRPAPATDPTTGKLLPLPPPDGARDAWGVRRSWGWATAEMFAINYGAATFNEYVTNANFNQISPRSFWHNFKEGFTYDDNKFKTNQLIHPFNGANYFNAARSNGLGFWSSSVMSVVGAFIWECCGETHPMSYNDMISTGIGGIARGEMAYRISSAILDNTKRGKGRIAREAAAFLVNPTRGFNRIVTGDAGEVQGNPADPYDWRPPYLDVILRVGGRAMGQGESITENTNYYGFAEATVSFGNAWDNEKHRPYDRFDLVAGMNFGDKTRLGRLLIRGDLYSRPIGDGGKHQFAIQQDFDYIDNEAYEYGGQSLGVSLFSRFNPSKSLQLWSRLQAYGIVLGAVNSDYSKLADVADQERYREYDYGPGLGASWELYLLRKGNALANFRYRASYLDVSNGSVYNKGNLGLDSNHRIQQIQARLDIPVTGPVAIGVDGSIFFRRSHYDLSSSGTAVSSGRRTITQRNPELRAYLAWHW